MLRAASRAMPCGSRTTPMGNCGALAAGLPRGHYGTPYWLEPSHNVRVGPDQMVTFQEFRHQAASFFRLLPEATPEGAENGMKQLGIAYLNMNSELEHEKYEAALIYQMAAEKMITKGEL